jgi:protein-S-isoprenylcysteine O-methyltransferase Ste14
MFILARALTYAVFFVGFFLVFLPAQVVLRTTGIPPPAAISVWQVAGLLSGIAGAALVLACILTFVFVGKGTQAPFDPPRRLVVRGPYRFVRNPMYIGAGLALIGAALFYRSNPQFAYASAFLVVTHVLVIRYEEPALRQTFKGEYDAYCARTGRWWPKWTVPFTIAS